MLGLRVNENQKGKLREDNTKSTALVPLNYQSTTFVSESARLASLARLDIVKALFNYRKKFTTKKEVDSMFLDLYNSGMYLPKVFKFIGTISIGTLHRWAGNIKDPVKGVEEIIIPETKDKYEIDLASDLKHEKLCEFYNNHDIYIVAQETRLSRYH